VKICGQDWADTTYDVYFGTGIPATQEAGIDVNGGTVDTVFQSLDTTPTGYLITNSSVLARYVGGAEDNVGPQTPGLYTWPGVATTIPKWSWFGSYLQVPSYGRPVSFESWYSENPAKTNPNVKFSGYTSYGYTYGAYPWLDPLDSPGYVKRYVFGVLRKDANIATCTTADIVLGAIFYGEPTHGRGYVVVNGCVVQSLYTPYKPSNVHGFTAIWHDDLYAGLNGAPQGYDSIELVTQDASYNNLLYIGSYNGDPTYSPIDTYNTKWGWYHHFVPDAGVGTYSGLVFADLPEIYTHPGWPI
jgi:hypothetical protein